MVLISTITICLTHFLPLVLSFQLISQSLYDDLVAYAHLMDIAYCISHISKIQPPFQCDNDCSDFPQTQVIQQWTSDEFTLSSSNFPTTGYLAINHDMKLIILGLRGTRSFKDTIIDINTDMLLLNDVCVGCKIHKGFYYSFLKTWNIISIELVNLINQYPDYKILIMGHSLGGAIALLLGMKTLEFNKNLLVITMGQPKIGNLVLTRHLDQLFEINTDQFNLDGKLIRVTHKNDPVVKLPISDNYFIFDRYSHCSNEVFIDEEYNHGALPDLNNILLCDGAEDIQCSYGMSFTRDNSEHLDYFRTMGKCGVSLIT